MPAVKKKRYATHVTLEDGRKVYVSAFSQEALQARIREVRARHTLGMDLDGANGRTLFRDYAKFWLQTYHPQQLCKPSTYSSYCNTLNNHVLPFFSDMALSAIKPIYIRLYLTHLAESCCKVQQQKSWSMFRHIMETAQDNGLISEMPIKNSDRLLRTDDAKEPDEPLTDDQVRRLLDAAAGLTIYPFVLIALSTGMRRGEILGLMWEDVDLANRVIHIQHNKVLPLNGNDSEVTDVMKSKAGKRDVPIPDTLHRVLTEMHETRNGSPYVLHDARGRSWTKSVFSASWNALVRRTAGTKDRKLGDAYGDMIVALDFHVYPHLLRHTYITKLFEQGLDIKQIQYLAGHSTPGMTLQIYTHYRERQRSEDTKSQVIAAIDYV